MNFDRSKSLQGWNADAFTHRTPNGTKDKAVVLLSGGLDSTTVLYIAKKKFDCLCLVFDYGQRHKKELKCAQKLARLNRVPFCLVKIKLPWSQSSLTDKTRHIPMSPVRRSSITIPSTYVAGRNTLFISYALSYAETIGAKKIFIGANAVDFSGYPDCRPEYYNSWNSVLKSIGTSIKIETPLLYFKKSEIIKLGTSLRVPYSLTWSCYKGGRNPCGNCDSCKFRAKGFSEAGIKDSIMRVLKKSVFSKASAI